MFQKRRKTYDLRRTSERLRSHHRVEPRSTSHSETDNEEEFVIANEEEDHLEVTIETTTCPSANEDNSAALTDATCSSEELGTANLVGARPLFYEDELRSSFDNNISSSLATALSLTHAFLITTRDRVAELNPELDWSSLEHGLKEEPLAPEIKVLLLKTLGRTLLGSRSLRCFEDNYFLLLEQQHKERLRQKSTIRKFEKNKDENSPATSTWTNENEKELSNLKVAQYSAFRKQKLGEDRYGSYYWFFSTIPDKLFVESFTQQTGLIAEGSYGDLNSQWSYYTAKETSEAALCLNSFGYCERELKANIFHLAQVFNWPPPLPEVLESVKSQLLLKEPIVQKRKDDLIYKRNGRKILELTMHLHTYYKDLLKERQEEYEWMKESRKKSYDLFLRERLGVSEPSEHNLERNERSGILFFFAQQDLLLLDNMMRVIVQEKEALKFSISILKKIF